ncbi:MAG: GNAT family N-acetyltransferase [Pseudomonadales bacterium]|nr:GNAT family N-acetyltransferase [Halieaceae bacterium]MCP5164877.1 GNAT family N-acetyltransferase [Pseudomonadales bacterium]MCP5189971.1 GNAT family N-acetyltransferase [Pseudomonadales bacterium]MCP5205346.1 GNAT family N-acetyltransferase [Pseudomonadales bacterium]
MPDRLHIRQMSRVEVDELVAWAANEGWNPGRHDARLFWENDPGAFLAAELDGELIGGGAITSYQGEYGFMGFFIVRPEYRGRGLGNELWHARRDHLIERLQPGATIGMDGVFDMQDYYTRGGFVLSHRNLRFSLTVPAGGLPVASGHGGVVPLAQLPPEQLAAYDRSCFPAPRTTFMRTWVSQPDSLALGYVANQQLAGFGVIRRCGEGCKIGPLFADDAAVADTLFASLASFGAGSPVYLDAPENNPAAMQLVRRYRMTEVFGCARMYLGPVPDIAHDHIFGVTTFELG